MVSFEELKNGVLVVDVLMSCDEGKQLPCIHYLYFIRRTTSTITQLSDETKTSQNILFN